MEMIIYLQIVVILLTIVCGLLVCDYIASSAVKPADYGTKAYLDRSLDNA